MVEVIKSGFYSTIQDMGRFGNQSFGVPVSGGMDLYSAKLANLIIRNNEYDAVIEMTATGSTLLFHKETVICLTGADMSPLVNDTQIKCNSSIKINPGDILSFGKLKFGFRSYLAVSGGFMTESVMNSRSMYENVTHNSKLSKGDQLEISGIDKSLTQLNASIKIKPLHFIKNTIEVFKGPEYNKLSKTQQSFISSMEFSISNANNRMAYQLNELIENNLIPIITSLVLPGTVQLTPSGILIVLMRDCQTTGGYPRVLQLKETAINILAQKSTNEKIRFKLIE